MKYGEKTIMNRCEICGASLIDKKKYVLMDFRSDRGIWIICRSCDSMLNLVMDRKRKRWVHMAIAILEEKMEFVDIPELRKYVMEQIELRKRFGMHKPYL